MNLLAVAFVCWTASARAADPSATTTEGAGGTVYAGSGVYGTGWIVTGGYFFKDTMFYSRGRGGPLVSVGRAFKVFRWIGVWTGGGVLGARGTMDTAGAGSIFRTTFDETVVYTELGIITPWLPFPVSLSLYRHSTDLTDAGVAGAAAGRSFTGRKAGIGLGVDVRVQFEFFFTKRRAGHRGLGLVAGYCGFMDMTGRALTTTDTNGATLTHPKWKPFAGEGLQLGLEYEF